MPSSSLIRHAGRPGLFIDARLVAGPLARHLYRFLEELAVEGEVDAADRPHVEHLRANIERAWQDHLPPASSSPSTPPVPHPEPRERDRIGTTDAAAILGRTPRAVRKMCIERRLPGARQDGPRGEWSVPRVVVVQVAGAGPGVSDHPPGAGAAGGSGGSGMGRPTPGG